MPRDDPEHLSKSQQKRAHHALQALAEALAGLSPAELERIPLSEALKDAVEAASGMQRGARQRQLRYIAKRLAIEDANAAGKALERLRHGSRDDTARHHRIERWRERLIEEGQEALSEFIAGHPQVDRQQLRQLIRNAQRERERDEAPRAFRRLYALLREVVE